MKEREHGSTYERSDRLSLARNSYARLVQPQDSLASPELLPVGSQAEQCAWTGRPQSDSTMTETHTK